MSATWSEAQSRAAQPGSTILTAWRAEREAARAAPRNEIASETIVSSDREGMLELFAANRGPSGVVVTPESAMRNSAVFACVQRIAGAVSSMPLHLYKRVGDGRERVEGESLWYLLNEQPTARYTAASHWEGVISHELLRGDAFTFIGRNGLGEPKELIPLPWGSVNVRRVEEGGVSRLRYDVQDVRTFGVDQDDMLHFPGFGFDGIRGMSVIKWAARNAAGNALAMDEYSGRFFANGAHPSIVIEGDNKMNQERIELLQSTFGMKYSGAENMHRLPLVLTEGLKAKSLSISAEDSQLLDSRKFQVVDIARAFGVPPHMIGETSASTSWGSGIEAMSRAFVQYTLQGHLVRIEQELNRKLFKIARNFVEFNRDALLEGDSKGQADYFRAALGGPGSGPGWMAVDEIRKHKNLKPMNGKSAEIYFPPEKPASKPEGTTP